MKTRTRTGPIYLPATPGPLPVDTTPDPAAERDLLRSRFASWADTFETLHARIATQPGDWGHLRHQVQSQLSSAAHLFRQYAAGLPSPQNYRRRAEAAEALAKALQERLRRYEDPAAATRDIRHPAMPGGVP